MTPHTNLDYYPATGELRWRAGPNHSWNKRFAGRSAGHRRDGRLQINYGRKTWQAARLAWEIHHGKKLRKDQVVTAINGDLTDIRLANLTVTTREALSRILAIKHKPSSKRWVA